MKFYAVVTVEDPESIFDVSASLLTSREFMDIVGFCANIVEILHRVLKMTANNMLIICFAFLFIDYAPCISELLLIDYPF